MQNNDYCDPSKQNAIRASCNGNQKTMKAPKTVKESKGSDNFTFSSSSIIPLQPVQCRYIIGSLLIYLSTNKNQENPKKLM